MNRRRFVAGALGSAAGAAEVSAQQSQAGRGGVRRSDAGRRRVLFFAVDAMDSAMVTRNLDRMPNIRRMMNQGYSGRILPYVSCWGNIDFMSMMTGAPPGTQYRSRTATGAPPRHQQCVSETIWQVLESEGRRSFLLEFPGAKPSKLTAVIPAGLRGSTISPEVVYQTGNVVVEGLYSQEIESTGWPPGSGPRPGRRPTVVAAPRPASEWSASVSKLPALETTLEPRGEGGPHWPALIVGDGNVYESVIVYEQRGGIELARLRVGQWSPWTRVSLTGGAAGTGLVRFQLLELAPDGQRLQILQSAVCASEGFSQPAGLAAKLVERLGPLWAGSAIPANPNDPFWEAGEAEAAEGAMWAAKAAEASLESWDWDFFLHKPSLVDSAMHQCLTLADPFYYRYNPEVARKADATYAKAYSDLDEVVGRLLEFVSSRSDTVLVVASDHGGGVNNTVCDVNQRLREAGLLAGSDRQIDWSRTRAYTKRDRQGTEIFINLKGREPGGIVSPQEYERVQEEVIDTLLDWRDPVSRSRAITYALKLRDAALLGYWGEEAGDVQFCYNPGFVWGVNPDHAAIAPSRSPVANHGPQVVTAATGYSSMMGHLLAWGPGIARGVKRDETNLGPVPIACIAPTLSLLLGCRRPSDCQLGPIQEMLDGRG